MKLILENGREVKVVVKVRFRELEMEANRYHLNNTPGGVCRVREFHNGNIELAKVRALQELCLQYNAVNKIPWSKQELRP